ncbi:sigma 54-interacting transcriptional regulator [Athalassotoga saccharophila]|uniref:sigma 54-interacting transcriptional regulator n=1 Tax=Athalassotoga saccharophila TaxID=1441386 RepID=UPI00137AA0E0|nr:sigma 54-interacting transcriptional regulator [Athalassotoga saccharophila]BBJ27354.1 luminescence regulatory protein LuxO [Athalassotoga saccharophila]
MKVLFIYDFNAKLENYTGDLFDDFFVFDDIENALEMLKTKKDGKFLIFVDRKYSKFVQSLKDFTITNGIPSRIFVNSPESDFSMVSERIISFDFNRYGGVEQFLLDLEKQTRRLAGISNFIRNLKEDIIFVSFSNLNMFISGETGTGKSLVTQIAHLISPRRGNRFLEINCVNVPEDLLESELFGHAKGAFTGAYNEKKGLLEESNGGTLFLDEIGEMPSHVQSKLLKVIETKKFMPIGSSKERSVDVRFCSATNQNPQLRLREDLFQRISEIKLEMIPLRERKEDIPSIVNMFLTGSNYNMRFEDFPHEVKNAFMSHNYPGNIRELRNIISRFIEFSQLPVHQDVIKRYNPNAFAKQELIERFVISMADLYMGEIEPLETVIKRIRSRLESEIARRVLNSCGWDKEMSAKKLSVSRKTIDNMIKKYGLDKRKRKVKKNRRCKYSLNSSS